MARIAGGKSALVEVKAVDGAYPLYGQVVIAEPKDAGPIWRQPGVIVAERSLLERLNVGIGSTLSIGDATVTIGGILGTQPDRLADRLAYGPRVLMSLETLDRTGLIQPGSLIRWIYRTRLPGLSGNDRTALNTARFAIEAKFPESGFAITDWTDPAPSIRREVQRFTKFISLVGVAALMLGGIGVANAIGSYMAKKRQVIATFKTLGASGRLVLAVYLIQALMLAGLGIVLGIVLGALTPALLSATYGDALPIALAVEPHPVSLLTAAGAGLLTMLLFVLLPLGRASVVPPAVLMRSHLTDEQERPPLAFIVVAAASGLALFALAIAASEERAITASISAGIVAGFLLLLGFGWSLQKLAARFRRTKPPAWALALASIAGPGSIARQVAVSLGLGLGFLVAIALIDRSLMAEFQENLQVDAPAYYFLDVDANDLAAFRGAARTVEPGAKLADAPMLRGRIVAVNGVPVDKVEAAPIAAGCSPATAASPTPTTFRQARPSPREAGGRRAIAARRLSPSMPTLAQGLGSSWATPSRSMCLAATSRPASPISARSTGSRSPSISSWCSRRTRLPARPTACWSRSNIRKAPTRRARRSWFRRSPTAFRWSRPSRSATSLRPPRSCCRRS